MTRPTYDDDDGGPGAGPLRLVHSANARAVLHPGVDAAVALPLMTTRPRQAAMGSGDRRPPRLRPGSTAANTLPSRVGNTLRWPDGQITTLGGTPLARTLDIATS